MRHPPLLMGLVAAAAVLLWNGERAEATVVLPLSLTELAERSDAVAHVRVGAAQVVATDGGAFRVTPLTVIEPFAGSLTRGEEVRLWQRGDGRSFVLGDARLDEGDEGLVFLVLEGERAYLTALAQAWWLREGSQSQVARRDLLGLRFAGPRVALPPSTLPWERLREIVRSALSEAPR